MKPQSFIKLAVVAYCLITIFGLSFIGVIIWAIITLVQHFAH